VLTAPLAMSIARKMIKNQYDKILKLNQKRRKIINKKMICPDSANSALLLLILLWRNSHLEFFP
jgi:hypothetical protein